MAKCRIRVPQVEFLGFLLDAKGIHPTPSKTQAIQEVPAPSSKSELQAFLGLLNFYNVFLPHKDTVAEALHCLLSDHSPWTWGRKEATAFSAVKDLLTSTNILVQYSANLPLTLTCDTSPYEVGAVLSHWLPSGTEAPITYFSRMLSPAERNYSQTDKEALAVVVCVKKFHNCVYGRFFKIMTDHKLLLGHLAGNHQTPQILYSRMIHWTVFLAAYDYKLIYHLGKDLGHADALSQCLLPTAVQDPSL